MTLQELRYFLDVAETGSFTAAAARSGVAQPSLSEQIKQLERSFKARLFDRLPRKVLLTAAGRAILPHARQVMATLDSLRGVIEHHDDQIRGPLTLAATSTLAPFIIAKAVSKFVKAHRLVEVALHELPARQIVERIKSGECDLGVTGLAIEDPQVLVEPLFSESLIVALRKRHPLCAGKEVSISELAGEPMILIDELRDIATPVLSMPARAESPRSIIGAGLQLATIEALVAAGTGVCLLPAMARGIHSHPGIAYRPIRGRAPVRTVSAIWHRDRVRPLAAQRFMEMLRSVISEWL